MKTLVIFLSLIFVAGSFAGETYKERRTRRALEQSKRTITHTGVRIKRNSVTEYDYGTNKYRVYKVRDEVNTDPIKSTYYEDMMRKLGTAED